MEQTIETLARRISAIEERNAQVSSKKHREGCWTRRIAIALITYVMIGIYMLRLGIQQRYLHALIPTAGFLLSTFSLQRIQARRTHRRK